MAEGPLVSSRATDTNAACARAREQGRAVAFVPTMGALHAGHLALVQEARRHAPFVVVSIFVNPTQFGANEDLARYPRDLAGDLRKLGPAGADWVFAPAADEMYPPCDETRVRVGSIAEPLEGRIRPGHFEGVATVVTKLFAVVGPCTAVFGRKDYQQLLVVRRLVRDLFLPVHVIGHPIVREADGLAMSSRNAYLSGEERTRALAIVRALDRAARSFAAGERRASELERLARATMAAGVSSIDYVSVCDDETLAPIDGAVQTRALLAVAARVGGTRLLDNIVLGGEPPPLG